MQELLRHPAARRFLGEDGRVNWAKVDAAQDWEIQFALVDLSAAERQALRDAAVAFQPSRTKAIAARLGGVNVERLRQRLLTLISV